MKYSAKKFGFFVFIVFFLVSPKVFSDGGVGVKVFLQSPKAIQRNPGEIFTIAFFLQNTSTKSDNFVGRILAPEGWETIPNPLPTIALSSGQQNIQIFAVKIPKYTKAGNYLIKYELQGTNSPELLGLSEISVAVLPIENIETTVEKSTDKTFSGKEYKLDVSIANFGNEKKKCELDISSSIGSRIRIKPKDPVVVEPGEKQTVQIFIKTHKDLTLDKKDFVKIKIVDAETKKELSQVSSIVKVYSSRFRVDDMPKYHYIPSKSTFVGGFQNGKKSIFVNTEGSGALNKEGSEKIAYLFRIPMIQHTSVYRQLGGTPEKYFLNYTSPHFDIYAGDGVYQMTPLTMTSRYGRGGYLKVKTPKVQAGALTVLHSSSVPETDLSTFLKFLPHEYFDVQATYYRSSGRILHEKFDNKDTSDIFSIDGVYKVDDKVSVQGEFAYSTLDKLSKSHRAFFINGFAKPYKKMYINFQKIYAPNNFFGYYSNQSQGAFSFGINPYKRLNIIGSYNVFSTNLAKDPDLFAANKYKRILAEMTYTFPKGIFLSGSYNRFKLFDRLTQLGYITEFGAMRFSQSYKRFSLLLNAELGRYENNQPFDNGKKWQNYQAYIYLRMKNITYNVYGRWGSIAQVEEINWNQTYGGSIKFFLKPVSLKLAYEQSLKASLPTKQYFYGKLSYTFKNRSVADVYGNFLKNFEGPNIYRVLFSYSLPWGLPVKKNIYRSQLKGRVYTEEHGVIKPSANAIITCNELEKKISSKGKYEFDYLTPGDYLVNIEGYDKNEWITEKPYPESLHLNAYGKLENNIILKKPANFSGNVSFYKIKDETTEKHYEYIVKEGSLSKLSLVHESTRELVELVTDSNGDFSLPRLRPGLWNVRVTPPELSNNFELETPEFKVELSSGDQYYKAIRILPIVRKLKMID